VIPLALGAAVSPVLLFGAVAAMTGERPLARGAAFALGAALPLVGLTAVALILGRALSLPEASNAVKGAIDIGFGVLLVALGVRALLRAPQPTAKARRQDDLPPRRLIGLGAGLMASNVTTIALYLPAMKLIGESGVATADKAVVVAAVFLITLAFVLVPLGVVAVAPNAAGRALSATGAWLSAHRRRLTIVISRGLGSYLVLHGLARVL
jgi:hypothetical protein